MTANDNFEPNDDFGSAVEITPGEYSALELVGDESDYYSIAVEPGDSFQLEMTFQKDADGSMPDNDPDLQLYDSEGYEIGYASERTTPAQSTVTHILYYEGLPEDLSAGNRLYVEVMGDSTGTTTDYDLDFRRNENDEFEPNGNVGSAASLQPGVYSDLTLLDEESDYYAVSAEEGETLNVTMTVPKADDGDEPDNDPWIELLDSDGEVVDTADQRTTNVQDTVKYVVRDQVESDGTYYLRAYGTDNAETRTSYDLDFRQSSNDRFESNGRISTAETIEPGTYDDLTLLDDESDYYAVDLEAGDTLAVNATAEKDADGDEPNNNPDLDIVDQNGDVIRGSDEDTTDVRSTISYVSYYEAQSSRTVYVHVHGDSDYERSAAYDLDVRRNANDRFEANGNHSLATSIEPGTYGNLSLLADENDYYAIDVAKGDSIALNLSAPKNADGYEPYNDPDLELVNSDGEVLDTDDERAPDASDTVDHVLYYEAQSTGTIYVRAHGDDDYYTRADYSLQFERNDNDDYEPNGDIDGATPVGPGSYEDLTLQNGEHDHYATTVDEGGTVNVTVEVWKDPDGYEPHNDPELELKDGDGNVLEYDLTDTAPARDTVTHTLEYTADSEETVYAVVYGDSSEVTAEYNLTVRGDVTEPATDENTPPSADAGGPYSVEPGSSVTLDASGSTDPDGAVADTEWSVASGQGTVENGAYVAGDDLSEGTTATVVLTVTDDDGAAATDTATVTVGSDDSGSGQHESGVSQAVFGAVAGADGSLSGADFRSAVRQYLRNDGVVDGVPVEATDIRSLVAYYIQN